MKFCKRLIMYLGVLVCVVHVMIVVHAEFALAIDGYDLVGVAIDGEEPKENIGRHPAVAIPLFDVDPEVDTRFRFLILKELLLSPPAPCLRGLASQSQPYIRTDRMVAMVVCKLKIFFAPVGRGSFEAYFCRVSFYGYV